MQFSRPVPAFLSRRIMGDLWGDSRNRINFLLILNCQQPLSYSTPNTYLAGQICKSSDIASACRDSSSQDNAKYFPRFLNSMNNFNSFQNAVIRLRF